jgi:hypothetical protein
MTEHENISKADLDILVGKVARSLDGANRVTEAFVAAADHINFDPRHSILLEEKLKNRGDLFNAHFAALLRGDITAEELSK